MKIFSVLLLIISFYQQQVFACDDDVVCPKCGEKSEFTWNPANQYVTAKLNRFYAMEALINSAYQSGDYNRAAELIKENLTLAAIYRCNWNYGNAIHDSNRILGFIALENNDLAAAANYLIEAGKSTGSPQLNSFGPNLDLANELLAKGEREAVISYLLGVREFWEGKESMIDGWVESIQSGEDVQLSQYQLGLFEMLAYSLTLAWPLILVFCFWFKIKARLANNWSFPAVAILSAFVAMFVAGMLLGPIVMVLLDAVSEDMLGPLIIAISVILQVGAPFLTVYWVARFFKNRAALDNS